MSSEEIYVIGELLFLNISEIVDITYPEGENPVYLTAEMKDGIKLKIEIINKENFVQSAQ